MMFRAIPLLLLALAVPARADERRYMLTGFDRIRLDGPFEVTVAAGTSAGAVASGERRALDSVIVRVEGTTLVIAPSANAWGGYPGAVRSAPRLTVTAAMVRSIEVVGGGRLTIDRMRGQRVDLTITGAGALSVGDVQADRFEATLIGTGKVTVAGKALRGQFVSNGVGTVEAGALELKALTVDWQSAGDGRFAASNTAQVNATGQGTVIVVGAPSCILTGNGPVSCGKN